MRNRIPCQRDAGTRLATALRRRPFSACNKGNRRRLHAGNKPTVKSCLFFKYVFIPREALTSSHCLVIWLKIVLSFRNQNYINSEKIYRFRPGVRYCCTRKKEVCVTPALIVFQHPAARYSISHKLWKNIRLEIRVAWPASSRPPEMRLLFAG